MVTKNITVKREDCITFNNQVDFCVGTGRLGLGLTKEYLDQLEMVQKSIGFKYIRGHGLFSDDMAIYHEYEENGESKVEYNYTYLDRLFDSYVNLNIRPFLELGFMPYKMASGSQTIFYWKGNTTPPKNYKLWTDMVASLLRHLLSRYGEEVLNWPIEVWNEPNLPGFWEKADMKEYFKLFEESFRAIKAVDDRFTVGGPAICGVNDEVWIKEFMEFVKSRNIKPDFITRHHYTVEFPEMSGHYAYHKLFVAEDTFSNLQKTRDIVDSYEEYRDLPIHITEFNTSYSPQGVIHDTNLNAAFLAEQLSRLGDMNESYSYWTFGDVFEEQGVPFTPFYGGFGLVANGCIAKPTFHTFAFYKELKKKTNKACHRDNNSIIVSTNEGYAGILWNYSDEDITVKLEMETEEERYALITKTVDEETCNPLKLWHDLGEPANPDLATVELLREASKPLISSEVLVSNSKKVNIESLVRKNGVVFFEIRKAKLCADRGYDYAKVLSTK